MACICFSDECILFIVNCIFKRITSSSTLFTKTSDKLLSLSTIGMMYYILQTYFSNIYVYVEQIVQTIQIHQLIQFLARSSPVHNERQMTTNTLDYGRFRTSPIIKRNFTGYNNHKMRQWSNTIKVMSTNATR